MVTPGSRRAVSSRITGPSLVTSFRCSGLPSRVTIAMLAFHRSCGCPMSIETDDAVLRRVRDFRQGDRHGGALALVEVVERLEVQIAQDVPHGDDEGFVEEISHPADRPRRAGGILFEAV